jgi:hypothetical protein
MASQSVINTEVESDTRPAYIVRDAKRFVRMLRAHAFLKKYKEGWVYNMYKTRYPAMPLTKDEYDNSGREPANKEFKDWVRAQHSAGLRKGEYQPSRRFKANAEYYKGSDDPGGV